MLSPRLTLKIRFMPKPTAKIRRTSTGKELPTASSATEHDSFNRIDTK
jgi:hypothetical protein